MYTKWSMNGLTHGLTHGLTSWLAVAIPRGGDANYRPVPLSSIFNLKLVRGVQLHMCTRLYYLKLGETVPTDICMPSAAWRWGQSPATQRPSMDQTHQQMSKGVTNNHGDRPSGPHGVLRGAPESCASSCAFARRLFARESGAPLRTPSGCWTGRRGCSLRSGTSADGFGPWMVAGSLDSAPSAMLQRVCRCWLARSRPA